jgi:glycosyltransferase involved in cell wall biosynthesis
LNVVTAGSDTLPFVSVVMPVRNEARFIRANLAQLHAQDYPPDKLEVIVADGMSTDGTREIVLECARHHPSIRLIDNVSKIVPTGLNAAIKAARGDIVIRVDGHVHVAPDFVRANVQLLRDQPEAWGGGGPIVHAGTTAFGAAVAVAMSHPIGMGNAPHRRADYEGFGEGAPFPAFHRWVFDRVGYIDESLVRNEDDEFNYRVAKAGGKIYVTPKVRSTYFVRDTIAGLGRQFFQYSFWRIPVIKKHRRPTTFRQVIPTVFFLGMLAAAVAGIGLRQPILALALPIAYAIALLATGVSMLPSHGLRVALLAPVALLVMHACYAAGMLYGVLVSHQRSPVWDRDGRMSRLSR